MAIDLSTKYLPYVDEQFRVESKRELFTNRDYSWDGAKSIKLYTISTSKMNDYDREGTKNQSSRYGVLENLNATTNTYTLSKDRSFTFPIDALDQNETQQQLQGATALARQNREVTIPEVDSYALKTMCANAGTKPAGIVLNESNIYDEIMKGNAILDDAEVLDSNRVIIVSPTTYTFIKRSKDFIKQSDIGQEMAIKGVVAIVDGLKVIKVPANRLPNKFGFMIAHPVATVSPVKLASYVIHENPPGINGTLVEGRIAYNTFVLENKKKALYYQAIS